jgi:hypothetical protein
MLSLQYVSWWTLSELCRVLWGDGCEWWIGKEVDVAYYTIQELSRQDLEEPKCYLSEYLASRPRIEPGNSWIWSMSDNHNRNFRSNFPWSSSLSWPKSATGPYLSKLDLIHNFINHSLHIHFNIILTSTPTYPKWSFLLEVIPQEFSVHFSVLVRATCPAHLVLLSHGSLAWQQISDATCTAHCTLRDTSPRLHWTTLQQLRAPHHQLYSEQAWWAVTSSVQERHKPKFAHLCLAWFRVPTVE